MLENALLLEAARLGTFYSLKEPKLKAKNQPTLCPLHPLLLKLNSHLPLRHLLLKLYPLNLWMQWLLHGRLYRLGLALSS